MSRRHPSYPDAAKNLYCGLSRQRTETKSLCSLHTWITNRQTKSVSTHRFLAHLKKHLPARFRLRPTRPLSTPLIFNSSFQYLSSTNLSRILVPVAWSLVADTDLLSHTDKLSFCGLVQYVLCLGLTVVYLPCSLELTS